MLSAKDVFDLEAMIDRVGLSSVLLTLGAICEDKADHIGQYADSLDLIASWRDAGDCMGETACSARVQAVTPKGSDVRTVR